MGKEYIPFDYKNMQHGHEVRFSYSESEGTRDVIGWVDRVESNYITVGNESSQVGTRVFNPRRYARNRISELELVIFERDNQQKPVVMADDIDDIKMRTVY